MFKRITLVALAQSVRNGRIAHNVPKSESSFRGIDGRLYFHDSVAGPTRQIVLSVNAGHLVPAYVRDLRGVLQREDAELGVLLSFEEPPAGMRSEAAEAGFYESPWERHPRIQLLTRGELLDGSAIDYPHVTGANVTIRRARRADQVYGESLQTGERQRDHRQPVASPAADV
jgi:hypothetical protein